MASKPSHDGFVIAALSLTALVAAVQTSVLGALGPFLPEDLVANKLAFGTLVGGGALAGAASALVTGLALDRFGRRAIVLGSMVVFAIASLGHLVVSTFAALLVVRGLAGLAAGAAYTAASVLLADLVTPSRRARAMTVFSVTVFLATPVALPLAVQLAKGGWWQGIFALQSLMAVGALAMLVSYVPEPDVQRTANTGGVASQLRRALGAAGVVACLASAALYSGAFSATVQFIPLWLDESGLLPKARQLWMWVVLGVAMAASPGLSGVVRRVGNRRFVMVSTAVVGVGVLGLGWTPSLAIAGVVGVPMSMLAAARAGALLALTAALIPASLRGTLMGVRSGVIQIGMGSMGVVAGGLSEVGGHLLMTAGMAAVIGVSFVLVWLGVPEPEES